MVGRRHLHSNVVWLAMQELPSNKTPLLFWILCHLCVQCRSCAYVNVCCCLMKSIILRQSRVALCVYTCCCRFLCFLSGEHRCAMLIG